MCMLVNKVKDEIASELVHHLYAQITSVDVLLRETDDVASRRRELGDQLAVLHRGIAILNEIRELVPGGVQLPQAAAASAASAAPPQPPQALSAFAKCEYCYPRRRGRRPSLLLTPSLRSRYFIPQRRRTLALAATRQAQKASLAAAAPTRRRTSCSRSGHAPPAVEASRALGSAAGPRIRGRSRQCQERTAPAQCMFARAATVSVSVSVLRFQVSAMPSPTAPSRARRTPCP